MTSRILTPVKETDCGFYIDSCGGTVISEFTADGNIVVKAGHFPSHEDNCKVETPKGCYLLPKVGPCTPWQYKGLCGGIEVLVDTHANTISW